MNRYRLIAIAGLLLLSTGMILKSQSALNDMDFMPLRERLSMSDGDTFKFEFTPRLSGYHEVAVECLTGKKRPHMEDSFRANLEVSADVLRNGSLITKCMWPTEDGLSFRADPDHFSGVIGDFMAASGNRYMIVFRCKRIATSLAASHLSLVVYATGLKEREFQMSILLHAGWSVGGITVLIAALMAINHFRTHRQ